jgi:hypothetical protein
VTETDLPPLDLSLLAKVTPDDPMNDASPQLPPNVAPDSDESPRPRSGAAGQPRTRETRAQREARRKAAPTPSSPDTGTVTYRPGILVEPLSKLYTAVGTLIAPFNAPVGTALVQNAEPCAEAWDRAARTDPRIRRMLMMLIGTSTIGELLAVHLPIIMAMGVTMIPAVRQGVQDMSRPPGQPPDYESPTVIRDTNGRQPNQ